MRFSSRTLSLATVFLILAGLGFGVWWKLRPESETTEGVGDSAADSAAEVVSSATSQFATDIPQPVGGTAVVRDTLWITVSAAGQAAAVRDAIVPARVEGVVRAVPVQENRQVGVGELLVQIDSTEFALAVARARSDLRTAQADYRQLTVFDDEIEDPEVREERARFARARSGLDQAEVALREAEIDLARTTVTAPFAGRVANLHVVPGQFVSQGTELLRVVDLDPIKVEVQVLEAELGYLDQGRRAEVTFAAFPGEVFTGRVETINPVVDPETRTGRVTLLLDNPRARIKPGMYARVTLEARAFADRLIVPRSAILERDRRTMLFVFEGDGDRGRAKWRYVCSGLESERWVEIVPCEEGTVEPGETVLIDGHHYLVHDATVRLVEDVAAEGGRPTR